MIFIFFPDIHYDSMSDLSGRSGIRICPLDSLVAGRYHTNGHSFIEGLIFIPFFFHMSFPIFYSPFKP